MRWLVFGLVGCGNGGETPKDCGDIPEIPYDGIDQDCDGADLVDVDQDGYPGTGDVDFDCDDEDPSVHPDAPEVAYDGIDQNCFEGDLIDQDGDGEPATKAGGEDCNDENDAVRPDASDVAGDGVDLNCDGVDGMDADGDGWASVESRGTDCDDTRAGVNPAAEEIWYDGLDQDCAGDCDFDQDGDGAVLPGSPVPDGSSCDQQTGPGADAPQDCNDENVVVGEITVVSVSPPNGALEVAVDTDVTVVLSEADPTASLVVRDAAGAVVAGATTSSDDATYTWDGTTDLDGGETYTVDFTYGCGPIETTFTTTYPILSVDPAALVGRVWDVDLTAGALTEPVNSASLFQSFLSHSMRLEAVSVLGSDLELRVGPATAGAQDECLATNTGFADLTANPALAGTSTGGPWAYVAGPLPADLIDPLLEGGIRGDGDLLVDVVLTAVWDTRPMVEPMFGAGTAEDELCVQVGMLGDACIACPDGSGDFCLAIRVEGAPAVDVGTALVPRTQAEIDLDVLCP